MATGRRHSAKDGVYNGWFVSCFASLLSPQTFNTLLITVLKIKWPKKILLHKCSLGVFKILKILLHLKFLNRVQSQRLTCTQLYYTDNDN